MFWFLHDLSIVKSHLFVKHYAFILNQGYAYKGKLLYQRFNTLNEKKNNGFVYLVTEQQTSGEPGRWTAARAARRGYELQMSQRSGGKK